MPYPKESPIYPMLVANCCVVYLLSTTGQFEARDCPERARIGQQKKCCVPSGQHQATHVCSDSPETLGAWLGSFNNPLYSPDLAPSDYYLFLALKNFLSDKKMGSREDCENRSLEFSIKEQDFYERGIIKLILKCQQFIQQNGAYLTQIGQSKTC
ncbi:hypothetical protein TNCV_4140961 [Trichonephila clavipes]|nr:hypothetical protein TNCV_4140961 [Trichonephila clavipes]